MNFDYFNKKLGKIPGFDGFTPRWTLITRLRNDTNPLLNSSSLLVLIVRFISDYQKVLLLYRTLKERLT